MHAIRMFCLAALLPGLASTAAAQRPAAGPPASSFAGVACVATAEGVAPAVLARAAAAIGLAAPGRVLRVRAHSTLPQLIQSDRTYPPYFEVFFEGESWFDVGGGALRTQQGGGAFPGSLIPRSPFPGILSASAHWILRDTVAVAAPDFNQGSATRALHPWAVVRDFRASADAHLAGRCRYRDYDRVAVERAGPWGPERLLLDAKTWVPVALVREEWHFLWGQVAAEYVWSNWSGVEGGGLFPLSLFRVADGVVEHNQTVTDAALLPADSAPRMAIPDSALRLEAGSAVFNGLDAPDTIRVGPDAWLLRNRAYTTAAVLARDTVFLLDATLSEARARQDSSWVARLFPGRHPVVLVVTDLAWPHIGGVRFWVANGATVVAHRAARPFLDRVVRHRWTRAPDLLETRRARAPMRFRAVTDSLVLGGGAITVHAIDGISSEVALMAWVPAERFLWPGDYIQNIREASQYAREVLQATRRLGIAPGRFAAQHVPLTDWAVIERLHADEAPPALATGVADGTLLRTGRVSARASLTRNGATTDRGEQVQVLDVVTRRGRPMLVAVREFQTPTGVAVDSSLADLATLMPIRHVGVHSSRTMVLEFDGAHVGGRYAPADEPARPINQALQARPFDSSLYDWVIAALPLAEGFAAQVPFYVYEQGGLVWYTVRVTGRERITRADGTGADTWAVTVHEGDRLRSRVWVSTDGPRDVVRLTQYISPGTEYTLTH